MVRHCCNSRTNIGRYRCYHGEVFVNIIGRTRQHTTHNTCQYTGIDWDGGERQQQQNDHHCQCKNCKIVFAFFFYYYLVVVVVKMLNPLGKRNNGAGIGGFEFVLCVCVLVSPFFVAFNLFP